MQPRPPSPSAAAHQTQYRAPQSQQGDSGVPTPPAATEPIALPEAQARQRIRWQRDVAQRSMLERELATQTQGQVGPASPSDALQAVTAALARHTGANSTAPRRHEQYVDSPGAGPSRAPSAPQHTPSLTHHESPPNDEIGSNLDGMLAEMVAEANDQASMDAVAALQAVDAADATQAASAIPALAQRQAEPSGLSLDRVRRAPNNITKYAKTKTDALLRTFATTTNPEPEQPYEQHPSVALLRSALAVNDPSPEQSNTIFGAVCDVLGHQPESAALLQRLGKALGVEDIPTTHPRTRLALAMGSKAAKRSDAARRQMNLQHGIVDKLLALRAIANDIIARNIGECHVLEHVCKLAPLQLNHILLNYSQGRRGPDILGLLEAACGQALTNHDRMQAVCEVERKLSSDTCKIVAKKRDQQIFAEGVRLGLLNAPFELVPISLFIVYPALRGLGIIGRADDYNNYIKNKKRKTPINIPRNEAFLNPNNEVNLLSILEKTYYRNNTSRHRNIQINGLLRYRTAPSRHETWPRLRHPTESRSHIIELQSPPSRRNAATYSSLRVPASRPTSNQRALTSRPLVQNVFPVAQRNTLQEVEGHLYRLLPDIIRNISIDNPETVAILEGLKLELMHERTEPHAENAVDYVEKILKIVKPHLIAITPESSRGQVDKVLEKGSLQTCIRMEMDASDIENILSKKPKK
jgi:hypothetical protein